MLKIIFLGVVQGLTEFLPVSSSGHLAVLQRLFGMGKEAVALDIFLHVGTTFALIIFFFKDILALIRDGKLVRFIALVTLITGLIGVAGKGFFESLFVSPRAVAIGWIVTGIILILTARSKLTGRATVKITDALILGVTQGCAIIPGLSRSGITVATLLFRGIDRQKAFVLSFIAAIPVVAGAALLESRHIEYSLRGMGGVVAAGLIASFVSGLGALWLLSIVIRRAKLHYFGYYCFLAAALTLLFVH